MSRKPLEASGARLGSLCQAPGFSVARRQARGPCGRNVLLRPGRPNCCRHPAHTSMFMRTTSAMNSAARRGSAAWRDRHQSLHVVGGKFRRALRLRSAHSKTTKARPNLRRPRALAGVPVNVIDKPAFCDFAFGAIVNRSPLVIGISTDGAAPVFRAGDPRQARSSCCPTGLPAGRRRGALAQRGESVRSVIFRAAQVLAVCSPRRPSPTRTTNPVRPISSASLPR